jgi:hypothetical protein
MLRLFRIVALKCLGPDAIRLQNCDSKLAIVVDNLATRDHFLSVQPASQAYDIALRRRAEELLIVAAKV